MNVELWGAFLILVPRPMEDGKPVMACVGALVAQLRLEDEDTWRRIGR